MDLNGAKVVVTGGTGSLGKVLVRRLLTGEIGSPESVTVFSRDEAKQHYMRLEFLHRNEATDDVIYENSQRRLRFRIGDVRDYTAVLAQLRDADIVFNAAALKQVPSCEYFPTEAVATNITGASNIVRAARENRLPLKAVIGISTDKACKPINVMGMTKAIQERIFIEGNLECPDVKFACVRYGNVIASRGSIVPLFMDQIRRKQPLTVTLREMTRFLLSLEQAVDTVFEAVRSDVRGETIVPKVASAKIIDVAKALMGSEELPIVYTGIRPGEKVHEIMVSEEECFRTVERGDHYVILPVLPELRGDTPIAPALDREYSSRDNNVTGAELSRLLRNSMGEIENFATAH
jgi:FlaA1/EpsC-like NDP-sugar epimerase